MIETIGPRQIATSGPAASIPAVQSGETVVHRPTVKVLPSEKIERNVQTGPRPAFQYTYLQRAAALWPEEPELPIAERVYTSDGDDAPPPDFRATLEDLEVVRGTAAEAEPTVDVRR